MARQCASSRIVAVGLLVALVLTGCAGRTRIEGLPDIKMTGAWPRLRGMEILLRHRGEEISLGDLLVYSGEAFHLCHGSKWELRTGLCTATNPWANLADAYGYAWRWTPPKRFSDMKRLAMERRWQRSNAFLEQIWESVDAGRPALLGGAYGECGTWRVVAGYDRDNKRVCYVGGETAYEWTNLVDEKVKKLGFWDSQVRGPISSRRFGHGGWLVNAAFLLGEKKASPSEKEMAIAALRLAVQSFRAKPVRARWYGGVTYHFGASAYQAWAEDLHELDYPADLRKAPRLPECYDMSHFAGQVESIVTGRLAAAEFCRKAAKLLPKAETHLRAAARAYAREVATAKEAFPAFMAGAEEQREAWLSNEAKREAGVAAIRNMLAEERAAIAEIEKVLAAMAMGEEA